MVPFKKSVPSFYQRFSCIFVFTNGVPDFRPNNPFVNPVVVAGAVTSRRRSRWCICRCKNKTIIVNRHCESARASRAGKHSASRDSHFSVALSLLNPLLLPS